MQSPEDARRIAESLVERGIAAGATAADALYIGERSSGVQVRLGELEDVSRSEGEQIGLRLFDGAAIGNCRLVRSVRGSAGRAGRAVPRNGARGA